MEELAKCRTDALFYIGYSELVGNTKFDTVQGFY